jgi:hypothetical protein
MTAASLSQMWRALDLSASALDRLRIQGTDALPSAFPVTSLAAYAVGVATLALSELVGVVSAAPIVTIDRRLCSLWFGWSIHPVGWTMPAAWDPIAGDYQTADGWIRLHTNAPHHRSVALSVLDCDEVRAAVAQAASTWCGEALEAAVVGGGGCAAIMRSAETWTQHPQGQGVAEESPIILYSDGTTHGHNDWRPQVSRPLAGLRVLDLTRVLAGPVSTRFLAGYGADVLRIDPLDWDEPGVVPEVTLGKRCARLDLQQPGDRSIFEHLLSQTDVLVHGYRAGALDALGYNERHRRAIKPDLIDVSLNAYGWSGPWKERRGFDSLVQMSTGIAAAGMAWRHADRPTPLPVQALDQATGYLMAAAVIRGLIGRLRSEGATTARLSLARTASLLIEMEDDQPASAWHEATHDDYSSKIEETEWGPAKRVRAPAVIQAVPMRWDRPASSLGSCEPRWST